jgi:hypothetical protein
MSQWDETCGICGQQGRWWTSRSGDRVRMVCAPDPFAALQTLARRVPGGVPSVQSCWRKTRASRSMTLAKCIVGDSGPLEETGAWRTSTPGRRE